MDGRNKTIFLTTKQILPLKSSFLLFAIYLFKLLTRIVSYRDHHFLKGPGGSLPEFMQQYFLEGFFSHRSLLLYLLCCRIWNTSDQDRRDQQNTDNISVCSCKQQTALHAITHQSSYVTTVFLMMQPKDLFIFSSIANY